MYDTVVINDAKTTPDGYLALSLREVLRANVISARAHARLTQEHLAKRAGVSRPTISRLERAQADIGIDALERIAAALDVKPMDLLEPIEGFKPVDDDELLRRANDPPEMFTDSDDFLAALEEADGKPNKRFGNAGRSLARKSSRER